MILAPVADAGRYRGTHGAVDRALALLATVPWLELEDGRHELAQGVHAMVSSYTTASPEASRYEAHREHADLQLVLQGAETICFAPVADLEPEGEYDPAGDILYFREPPAAPGTPAARQAAATSLHVRPGLFALLYPEDAHKPGRTWGTPQLVRKAVIKIRL